MAPSESKASPAKAAGSSWKYRSLGNDHCMNSQPASVPARKRSGPPPRILVAEDELPMRTALEDCLAAEGFRVFSATDGERGLERALKEKPDLILLDVMMPR